MNEESNLRTNVRRLENILRESQDSNEFLACLKELCDYIPPDPYASKANLKSETESDSDNEEHEHSRLFMKKHYVYVAKFLLDILSIENVGCLSRTEFTQSYLHYFLCGSNEDAFLVLLDTIWKTRSSYKQNKCIIILEQFLKQHSIASILHEQTALNKSYGVPMYDWRRDGRLIMWELLINEMTALPDKMANKLKSEVGEIFLVKHFIPLLISDIMRTLTSVCKAIRLSRDCNLEFISQLVGKLCVIGHADLFWSIMLKHVTKLVQSDFIWSRVLERIVTGVPDRCMESVLLPLVKVLPWYGLMDRFLGNCVTQKQKIQLLLCTKIIFHRFYKSPHILQNVIGYLATTAPRRHLFIKLVKELIQVWGDQSSLSHTSYEQHYYLTQAVIICMAFITDEQKQEHKDEILRMLMTGVQNHISMTDHKGKKLGMIVAVIVTNTVDPDGPKLNFEIDEDEIAKELRSLIILPENPFLDEFMQHDYSTYNLTEKWAADSITALDTQMVSSDERVQRPSDTSVSTPDAGPPPADLDSDDDLEPYDMSNDTETSKVKSPKYIRDCMEGLISCDNPDTLEACLGTAETLIRSRPDGLLEIGAEFAKVLLHLTESYSLPDFRTNRFNSLVALAVMCPQPVAEFLTEQFYDRNYSIRQRLDIIEVIGTAAQELSKPKELESKTKPAKCEAKIQDVTNTVDSLTDPESWRDVVQKRIDSKTRRFIKGPQRSLAAAVENKFAPVAGYFFYPLMKNFDRRENTFDLMGEDCFVLCRLMYTLGIVMYAASNIPNVRAMASCLLEFIWVLRFHADSQVRQGLLFAISMVYLAVPQAVLLNDLQQEVFESKNWLEDVIEKDVDTTCKTLAVQALVLLENIMKQEFLSDAEFT